SSLGIPVRARPEGAVGSTFTSYLEALPDAPMDEILDVRARLRDPLARFRAGVSRVSDVIALAPYSAEFPSEVAALYRREVGPALAELRDLEEQMGLRAQVLGEVTAHPARIRDAALVLTATNIAGLDALLAAVMSAAVPIVESAGSVLRSRAQLVTAQRQNTFFF